MVNTVEGLVDRTATIKAREFHQRTGHRNPRAFYRTAHHVVRLRRVFFMGQRVAFSRCSPRRGSVLGPLLCQCHTLGCLHGCTTALMLRAAGAAEISQAAGGCPLYEYISRRGRQHGYTGKDELLQRSVWPSTVNPAHTPHCRSFCSMHLWCTYWE